MSVWLPVRLPTTLDNGLCQNHTICDPQDIPGALDMNGDPPGAWWSSIFAFYLGLQKKESDQVPDKSQYMGSGLHSVWWVKSWVDLTSF